MHAHFGWYGITVATLRRNGWGTRQPGAVTPHTAPSLEADTIRIPLAKLLDPVTEITLETHLPRHARA